MNKFRTTIPGYSKTDVNSFVDVVTKEYEAMLNKLKVADAELAKLRDEVSRSKDMERTLNRALIVAEETSRQMRNVAKDEAKDIVDEARRNASRIVNDALMKATEAESEADLLRRRVAMYKRRVKQAMQEQMDMIDEIDTIQY